MEPSNSKDKTSDIALKLSRYSSDLNEGIN